MAARYGKQGNASGHAQPDVQGPWQVRSVVSNHFKPQTMYLLTFPALPSAAMSPNSPTPTARWQAAVHSQTSRLAERGTENTTEAEDVIADR